MPSSSYRYSPSTATSATDTTTSSYNDRDDRSDSTRQTSIGMDDNGSVRSFEDDKHRTLRRNQQSQQPSSFSIRKSNAPFASRSVPYPHASSSNGGPQHKFGQPYHGEPSPAHSANTMTLQAPGIHVQRPRGAGSDYGGRGSYEDHEDERYARDEYDDEYDEEGSDAGGRSERSDFGPPASPRPSIISLPSEPTTPRSRFGFGRSSRFGRHAQGSEHSVMSHSIRRSSSTSRLSMSSRGRFSDGDYLSGYDSASQTHSGAGSFYASSRNGSRSSFGGRSRRSARSTRSGQSGYAKPERPDGGTWTERPIMMPAPPLVAPKVVKTKKSTSSFFRRRKRSPTSKTAPLPQPGSQSRSGNSDGGSSHGHGNAPGSPESALGLSIALPPTGGRAPSNSSGLFGISWGRSKSRPGSVKSGKAPMPSFTGSADKKDKEKDKSKDKGKDAKELKARGIAGVRGPKEYSPANAPARSNTPASGHYPRSHSDMDASDVSDDEDAAELNISLKKTSSQVDVAPKDRDRESDLERDRRPQRELSSTLMTPSATITQSNHAATPPSTGGTLRALKQKKSFVKATSWLRSQTSSSHPASEAGSSSNGVRDLPPLPTDGRARAQEHLNPPHVTTPSKSPRSGLTNNMSNLQLYAGPEDTLGSPVGDRASSPQRGAAAYRHSLRTERAALADDTRSKGVGKEKGGGERGQEKEDISKDRVDGTGRAASRGRSRVSSKAISHALGLSFGSSSHDAQH